MAHMLHKLAELYKITNIYAIVVAFLQQLLSDIFYEILPLFIKRKGFSRQGDTQNVYGVEVSLAELTRPVPAV